MGAAKRPTVPEVLPLVNQWMTRNPCGGVFHIVLEDGNCEQTHIDWCLQEAIESKDEEAIALGRLLVAMSTTQRYKLYNSLEASC